MNKQQALLKSVSIGFSAVALSLLAFSARALPLVSNGSFESTTGGTASFFLNNGAASLTDWFLGPPKGISNEVIFAPGTADTTGAIRSDGVQFGLWGPGNGVANGLPATSPDGGNFVAFDGDTGFNVSLNQSITGLTINAKYQLSFEWAASQYRFINSPPLFIGATSSSWQVSLDSVTLGGQTFTTPMMSIASQGSSGWLTQSFTFTATDTSEVLSFLAVGAPNGLPPVALLDGVSLVAVPEPETLALLVIGLLGILATGRQQKKRT